MIRTRTLIVVAVLAAFSLVALALDVPPAPTQWVTDSAGILPDDAEAMLNEKLRAFEDRTGSQLIVYTLPSIERDSIESFTIRAAEKWRVGQKKADNGLILFVFVAERKARIEVGYGLEGTITDAVSAQTIRNEIAPHFQNGDYVAGLNAAADALMARIEGKEVPQPVARRVPGYGRPQQSIWPFLILIIFIIFVLPMLRRSGCGCLPLFFLPGGGGGITFGGGGFGGGGSWGGGGGGFSGGGGSFGGGGATGGW